MKFDVIIVGGGLSAVQTAAALRQRDFAGSIALVSAESHLPYDRPPLSKAYLNGEVTAASLALKSEAFFASNDITRIEGVVTAIDPIRHVISTEAGDQFGYGTLVWAAGGAPRTLPLPGSDLAGVLSLRWLEDADQLRSAMLSAKNAVIIGGGHIGLEVAASLRKHGVATTVLEAADRLLARVTSPVVSDFYLKLHQGHGVNVVLNARIAEIIGDRGTVAGVRMQDGAEYPADMVVVGVGIIPAVAPLQEAGAECSNGVDVDDHCRTSLPDVYALGDCANRATEFSAGQRVRLESVPSASEQAKIVAASILGQEPEAPAVPWFWSHQYDVKLQTAGLLTGYDEAVVRGSVDDGKFSVVYLRDGEVIALDCVNTMRDFARGKLLVAAHVRADTEVIRDIADLKDLLGEPVLAE